MAQICVAALIKEEHLQDEEKNRPKIGKADKILPPLLFLLLSSKRLVKIRRSNRDMCSFLCRDRFRTLVNVLGDAFGSAIVDHYSKNDLAEVTDDVSHLEMTTL